MKQIEKQLKSENAVKTIQNKFRQNRQEKKTEKKAEILQNQKLEKGISAVKAIQNKFRENKNKVTEINLNEDINNLMKNYTKVKAQKNAAQNIQNAFRAHKAREELRQIKNDFPAPMPSDFFIDAKEMPKKIDKVFNPLTGRLIKKGSQTYNRLKKQGIRFK